MTESVRRLAAVLLTDMVGYSALTERDESVALHALEEQRRIVRGLVPSHRGREVKTIGDAILLEFESALEAVEAGIEIQRAFFDRNRRSTEGRIELRIGIHAGDVVHEGNDVYGDAVNIVARIEPLAAPGGIVITGPVFEQVRNRLAVSSTRIETPPLKNIDAPVTLYRLDLPWVQNYPAGRVPLTGREPELSVLRGLLEEALQGHGRLVVLSGEAGIGKSRIVRELAELAESRGATAAIGRALPGELSAPYAPWVETARALLRDAPPQLVYRLTGNYAGDLEKLVPELEARVGPLAPRPALGSDEARIRFLEAGCSFYQNAAREFPLLLVLEDLHWADSASLRLLQFFARRIREHRILLVVTYSETEYESNSALDEVLADLHRERLVESLALRRLPEPAVSRLVEQMAGSDRFDRETLRSIYRRTGGNPFFVEETVRSLLEEGVGPSPVGASGLPAVPEIRLPATVRRVLKRRLARVDPTTLDVLQVASVVGYDFAFETLRAVLALEEEQLLEALDRALRARLIDQRRQAGHRFVYCFADRQLRDLLYEDQNVVRRRKYHLKVARALEAETSPAPVERSHELAYHYLEGNDYERALTYSVRAAERANRVHAREDATRHYRLALEILELRDEPKVRAAVLEALAENERLVGDMSRSLAHTEEATALYARLGDRLGEARGHLAAGSLQSGAYYDARRANEEYEAAERALEGLPESVELGQLYLNLAFNSFRLLPTEESRGLLRRAIDVGERLGDTGLAVRARFGLLWATPIEEASSVSEQLASLARVIEAGQHDSHSLRGYYSSAGWNALLNEGDAPKAIRTFEAGVARLRELGAESVAVDVAGQDLALAYLTTGDIPAALRIAEESYDFAVRNYPTPDAPNLLVLADVARLKGDVRRSREILERVFSLTRGEGSYIGRLAPASCYVRLFLGQGQVADAQRVAREALDPFLRAATPASAIAATDYAELLSLAIEALAGEPSGAESDRLLDELRRVARLLPAPGIRAFVSDAEGVTALRQRKWEAAASSFRASVEAWTALDWKLNGAHALACLATTLRRMGDERGADAALESARALLERLGASGEAVRLERTRGERLGAALREDELPRAAGLGAST